MRSSRRPLVALAVFAALVGLTAPALAEDTRVFLRFAGDEKTATALSENGSRFTAAVLEGGGVAFAGTSEMDGVYADCRQQVGVSATVERECQLKAARRIFVEQVLELSASKVDGGWEITLTVWDPENNASIHVSFVEVAEKSLEKAAREGFPQLAAKYLCFRGVETACDGSSFVPEGPKGCPVGQVATEDGHCCWPGQAWNGKRCVGEVSECAHGFDKSSDGKRCDLWACLPEQKRPDGVHCCWGDQGWNADEKRCVGDPVCPERFFEVEERCEPGNGNDKVAMSLVRGTTFAMGSSSAELDAAHELCKETGNQPEACQASWYDVEKPRHKVALGSYFIDAYEVTNEQYEACVAAGACTAVSGENCVLLGAEGWVQGGTLAGEFTRADRPVVCVSWQQARDYCVWTDKSLPSEAQWELAARGPDSRRYPWGNEWQATATNWGEQGGWGLTDGYKATADVGKFPAGVSVYGVHDMAGNVWEWVSDYWGSYEGKDIMNPSGPTSGSERVMRGGGFGDAADTLRSSTRASGPEAYQAAYLGFRCALSVE